MSNSPVPVPYAAGHADRNKLFQTVVQVSGAGNIILPHRSID
jgi:hypothetical protein